MTHPSEELLNEYLDSALASSELVEVEAHLAACPNCAARLLELRSLFAGLAALPELPLARDLAPAVLAGIARRAPLPGAVRWLLALQSLLALLLLWLAAPRFDFGAYPLPLVLALPSPADVFALLAAQGALWLGTLLHFKLPTLPALDISMPFNASDLGLALILASLLLLWLVGNRALLRPRGPSRS